MANAMDHPTSTFCSQATESPCTSQGSHIAVAACRSIVNGNELNQMTTCLW